MEIGSSNDGRRATIMVTNDDGIEAPGLQALVQVLVSTKRYVVQVCAPDSEKSGVSHSTTCLHPISVKQVEIQGTTAFAVSGTPADCVSLGVSKAIFPSIPDLPINLTNVDVSLLVTSYNNIYIFLNFVCEQVISDINKGNNYAYNIVYSGTVAGTREAFVYGVPSISISYYWAPNKSQNNDFKLSAMLCLPIISKILENIKNQTYTDGCFLNIDLPTNIANHKGYKLTKQGRNMHKFWWKQITSQENTTDQLLFEKQLGHFFFVETKENDNSPVEANSTSWVFRRVSNNQVDDKEDTDKTFLRQGYITITSLGALSCADKESHAFFKDWLPKCIQ
ncbi:hypothetical protein UlMin_009286 [Ulmus minor]